MGKSRKLAALLDASGNVDLPDNGKLLLGAGDDLEIYHDGSNSYIKDAGTGDLYLQGSDQVRIIGASETMAIFDQDGGARLFHNNVQKFTTTATGVDITGGVKADGLVVDGNPVIKGLSPQLFLQTGNGNYNFQIAAQESVNNAFEISSGGTDITAPNNTYTKRVVVQNNGDISFYEDTGTTAKFFWSSASERLSLTGSDYQFNIKQGSNQPWYLRGISNGKFALHLNGTGDVLTANTSGNVLVGTTTDYNMKHVIAGVGSATTTGTGSYAVASIYDTSSQAAGKGGGLAFQGNDGVNTGITYATINGAKENSTSGNYASYLGFSTRVNSGVVTERMRIDSSGNVGIGVIPKAWHSEWDVLDIGMGGSLASNATGTSTRTFVTDNAYNAGGSHSTTWKRKIAEKTSQHEQIDGKHVFRVAATGAANSAITWTDAVTIDNSGNVIAKGTLSGSNGTTGEIQLGKGTVLTTGAGTYDTSVRWNGSNGNLLFSQGAVEKMRITNTGLNVTGKVGIGTSSINGLLQIGDASAEGTQAAPALQIGGNTAYRLGMYTTNEGAYIENKNGDDGINFIVKTAGKAMKLSATGKLAVGNTASATGTTFNVRGNGSTAHLSLFEGTTAGDVAHASIYIVKKDTNSTSAQSYIAFVNGGAASGEVTGNGASQAAFSAWSDSRLKENVVTLPSQLDNIMALRPVEFDYKDGSGHQIGFIAQELKEVYPCCVSESADTGMLKVGGWNKTEARLVKAMQEQQVLIELLTARITVLEEV